MADKAPHSDITRLLGLASAGDRESHEELFHRVHSELRRIAGAVFRSFLKPDELLQPTALVNEAYLRLLGGSTLSWESRLHFFNVAAVCMRRILLDAARKHQRARREGKLVRVDLDDRIEAWQSNPERLFAMDAALESLREADPRCAEVVHLRFILGFSVDQTAELMAVSKRTVQRDWDFARAWLEARLKA